MPGCPQKSLKTHSFEVEGESVVVVEPLNPFSQGLEHVNRRIGATVAELNDLTE